MDLNSISSVTSSVATTYTTASTDSKKESEETKSTGFSSDAAVYEKTSDSSAEKTSYKKTSSQDRTALIEQLKADQERLKSNLFDIVRKSISGQGNAFAIASEDNMWKFLASGNFTADAATIAQAKEDISENGYWGVEQTSSRIVDFAIALSGNDTSKAELLIDAFKKGYEQATGTWGKDLPDISSQTYDKVMEKFQSWQDGTYSSSDSE